MENIPKVEGSLDQLNKNIDQLENALQSLLSQPLDDMVLPLDPLDQANLYILYVYALDSILFAHLKTAGVDTKSHPIMRQLERVKSYMDKVSEMEPKPEEKPKMKLDKQAAARIIKNSLNSHTRF